MSTEYHAEHVGSLLRPPWLLAARAARRRGELGTAELRDTEDRAALDAIEVQRQAGMPVFTDGELRRENWMDGLLASVGGVVGVERPHVRWHREGGTPPAGEPTSTRSRRMRL